MQNQPIKRCLQCGNLLHHNAQQCPNCHYAYGQSMGNSPPVAAPMMTVCRNCRTPIDPMARYCGRCGADQMKGANRTYPRGVDDGFCLSYFSLSYRRKFIRTLWTMGLAFLFLLPLDIPDRVLWFLGTILIGIAQAAYNFYQWHNLEAQPGQSIFR